jgi:hypothetical protein
MDPCIRRSTRSSFILGLVFLKLKIFKFFAFEIIPISTVYCRRRKIGTRCTPPVERDSRRQTWSSLKIPGTNQLLKKTDLVITEDSR